MLLAHLSDLHIRARGEKLYDFIDTNALCARHVAYLNNLRERPDAVVITGDITNCGSAEEYIMARRILSLLDYPVYLIPGNHDNNAHMVDGFTGFARYLGEDPQAIHYVIDDFPVRCVFIDSSVDGELHGHIREETLDWLTTTLEAQPAQQTILFMHHHPLPMGCVHMDLIRCLNGEKLLRLLKNFPQVSRIYCGHTHRTIFHQVDSLIICTAPSTCHQVPFDTQDPSGFYSLEKPSMLMHRYAEDTGLVSYVASLEPFDGPFRFDMTDGCPKASGEE